MNLTILFVLICMILNTVAQLLLKLAMNRIGHFDFTLANFWPIGWKVATSPYIITGLSCYVLSVVLWLLVLSRSDVTVAYPMTSIAFILTAFSAYFFMGEVMTVYRIAGIAAIVLGIYLITR